MDVGIIGVGCLNVDAIGVGSPFVGSIGAGDITAAEESVGTREDGSVWLVKDREPEDIVPDLKWC